MQAWIQNSATMVSAPRSRMYWVRTVAYWVFTLIVAYEMAAGGIWDLLRIEYVRVIMAHLGYPMYVLTIIGVWKIPCAVVLLVPRFLRLKEWAYARGVFQLHRSGGFPPLCGRRRQQVGRTARFRRLHARFLGSAFPGAPRCGSKSLHRQTRCHVARSSRNRRCVADPFVRNPAKGTSSLMRQKGARCCATHD